jgi:fumarate reductase flavoprotein subunit
MYGKDPTLLNPVGDGPYYLVEGRANYLCTLGGLRIDTAMRVRRADRSVIPGLYAAGCDASGGLVNNAYVSYEGVTLGWACTSGRLAGEGAAAFLDEANA